MSDLVVALGLVLVIEGIFYAGFPETAKSLMRRAIEMPGSTFRFAGLAGLGLGLAVVWLVRG